MRAPSLLGGTGNPNSNTHLMMERMTIRNFQGVCLSTSMSDLSQNLNIRILERSFPEDCATPQHPIRTDRYERTCRCNRDGGLVHMIRSNMTSGLTSSAGRWSRGMRGEYFRAIEGLTQGG